MPAVILIMIVILAPTPAHGYLDPGTGSMILQLILGGVAGALVVGKLYWHRMKQFFTGGPAKAADDDNDS